jgi:hypothetical protein
MWFGDIKVFAVQLELEPITEGLGYLDASAIGSTGLRLVDYGLGTSLRDVSWA